MKSFIYKIKIRIIIKIFWILEKLNLYKYLKLSKLREEIPSFKLVFFCGKYGISYLNASLFSVHKSWKALPEVLVISDGTPVSDLAKNIIKWPMRLDIIDWTLCADYFREKSNIDLFDYANKELWGKKLVAVLYCSEHFPTLYSDSDILWFSALKNIENSTFPILKMGQDIDYCFSNEMLKDLNEEKCLLNKPLNAGLIYAYGDFSSHPKWKEICSYLSKKPDNRTEQTTFAILNNYFNPDIFWSFEEVLIKLDDTYSLKSTIKQYHQIMARHYVNVKSTTFWRDSIYILLKKPFKKIIF
jgi:hypothetical protein